MKGMCSVKKMISVILAAAFAIILTAAPAYAAPAKENSYVSVPAASTVTDSETAVPADASAYTDSGSTAAEESIPEISEDMEEMPEADASALMAASAASVNVTVPVKILFAAFAEDQGKISSPVYEIGNNNHDFAVGYDVQVTSFSARHTDANTAVDPYLHLELRYKRQAWGAIGADNSVAVFDKGTGLSGELGLVTPNSSETFTIQFEGTYTGSFSADRMPRYDMVLKFTVV